jgi:hypothetical protein
MWLIQTVKGLKASIERWVKLESSNLVGEDTIITEGVSTTRGDSIHPSKKVESILEPHQVI